MTDAHWRAPFAIVYDGRRKTRVVSRINLAIGSNPRRLIDRDSRSVAIYVGAWLVAVLVSATVNAAMADADGGAWARYFLLYGGYWSLWGLTTPLIYGLIARPRPPGGVDRAIDLVRHGALLVGLVLTSNLYFLVYNSAVAGAVALDAATYWSRFAGSQAVLFVGAHLLKYAVIGLICSSIWHQRTRQQEERARIAAELKARSLAVQLGDAKLANLREQLHPHFLFNALNCIASLIEIRRNSDAYAAVSDLAKLLRQTLEMGRRETVTLREDVEHARSYLRIAELRYGSHLNWRIEVDATCESIAVPPLLLQPLVENAVKHAANQSEAPVCIVVTVLGDPDHAEILVSDDGPGLDAGTPATSGSGIGLGNLRERLALMYGAGASLALGVAPSGRGTAVRIVLPRQATFAESGAGVAS
jgi:signal transduction histidine kinase